MDMADQFVCFVCKARANCISDLHLHQTSHSVDQLSLALLTSHGVMKTEDIRSEGTNSGTNSTISQTNNLQVELSKCMTAIDQILPVKTTKQGRRKKNPKPRRNYKRTSKKKSPNQEGVTTLNTTRNQKLSKESNLEVNVIKPIQQPQLSSTITTSLPPKRSLRKKALVNYYDRVNSPRTKLGNDRNQSNMQELSHEANSSQGDKVRGRRYVNHVQKPSSDKNSLMLKSMLMGKRIDKDKTPLNIIDSTNYKYLQPKYNIEQESNFKIKENVTWNRVYQNYVQGFESYRESMKIHENYVLVPDKLNLLNTQTNIENQQNVSQYQQNMSKNQQYMMHQNQHYMLPQNQQYNICQNQQHVPQANSNATEGINYYNRNSMMRNSELAHYTPEKPDNINSQNKNLIEQTHSLYDWRNTEPVHLDTNYNEDPNVENLINMSLNLTSEVKDIIVEFLAQEENARARNPYWEDNMDKYFPSETDSSSEIEQFNDQENSSNPYAMDVPLNLVVTQPSVVQPSTSTGVPNNGVFTNFNDSAKCKSTWSEKYMNHKSETSTIINNNYYKSYELSPAYKYKIFCSACKNVFHNQNTLTAHFKSCRGKMAGKAFEMEENQIILDHHVHKNFCTNTSTTTMINVTNKVQMASNNYHCHICKIGFVNRTKYCNHMLDHKKVLHKNLKLCAACGLTFNGNKALQDHESRCEYKFLL